MGEGGGERERKEKDYWFDHSWHRDRFYPVRVTPVDLFASPPHESVSFRRRCSSRSSSFPYRRSLAKLFPSFPLFSPSVLFASPVLLDPTPKRFVSSVGSPHRSKHYYNARCTVAPSFSYIVECHESSVRLSHARRSTIVSYNPLPLLLFPETRLHSHSRFLSPLVSRILYSILLLFHLISSCLKEPRIFWSLKER